MKLILILWLLVNAIMLIFAKQIKAIIRKRIQERQVNAVERAMQQQYEEEQKRRTEEILKERENRLGKPTFCIETENDGCVFLYPNTQILVLQDFEIKVSDLIRCSLEKIKHEGKERLVEKVIPLTKDETKKMDKIQFIGKKYTYVAVKDPDTVNYVVTILLSDSKHPTLTFSFTHSKRAQRFKSAIEEIIP